MSGKTAIMTDEIDDLKYKIQVLENERDQIAKERNQLRQEMGLMVENLRQENQVLRHRIARQTTHLANITAQVENMLKMFKDNE